MILLEIWDRKWGVWWKRITSILALNIIHHSLLSAVDKHAPAALDVTTRQLTHALPFLANRTWIRMAGLMNVLTRSVKGVELITGSSWISCVFHDISPFGMSSTSLWTSKIRQNFKHEDMGRCCLQFNAWCLPMFKTLRRAKTCMILHFALHCEYSKLFQYFWMGLCS